MYVREGQGLTHEWKAVHPIAFMPLLLGLLGPNIVPVYKAALSGQRIVRLVFGLLIKSDILNHCNGSYSTLPHPSCLLARSPGIFGPSRFLLKQLLRTERLRYLNGWATSA